MPPAGIAAPGGGLTSGARCFYTHVPSAVVSAKAADSTLKLPLVIDMHGGGGCAHHRMQNSGWKELADSLAAADPATSFVTVWPQGYDTGWGTCGSDCAAAQREQDDAG